MTNVHHYMRNDHSHHLSYTEILLLHILPLYRQCTQILCVGIIESSMVVKYLSSWRDGTMWLAKLTGYNANQQ